MHTIFNRNNKRRQETKSRKVFKDSLDYIKENEQVGVPISVSREDEKKDFRKRDRMLRMVMLVIFGVVIMGIVM